MVPNKEQKIVDAKEACCMDTLSKPIEEAMLNAQLDEVIEVVVRPSFQKMVYRLAEEKGYTILDEILRQDEICFRIVGGKWFLPRATI